MDTTRNYLFLLRTWQEGSEWRWLLQQASTEERLGFSDLDALYLYLTSLTSEQPETGTGSRLPPEA